MRLALISLLFAPALVNASQTLTVERLYSDPALSGSSPRTLKVAPDGERVTFLRGKADNQNVLDLWEYHVGSRQTRMLVDSVLLGGGGDEQLSDEEKARRERLRIAGIGGIVDYHFSNDGKSLLFPIAGSLFVQRIGESTPNAPVVDAAQGFATDPKFSPKGAFVSFVRERALWIVPATGGEARRVSPEAEGTVSYGMAEFVAQEEMGRLTGYWWAPDDSALVYARVDEARVPVERRFEIYADRTEVIEQRYPAAGTPNAEVRLFLQAMAGGEPVELDLGPEGDIYLARVDWTPDAKTVLVQRQSRDQRTLDLLAIDASSGEARTLLSETSQTWVNLHDDLRVLADGKRFVWSSERDGYKHLELRALADGERLHAITRGPWVVDDLLAIDARRGRVYYSGNADDPREKHVYWSPLDGSAASSPNRVTLLSGWNEAAFASDGRRFVETFSDPNTPPQVRLRDGDGKELAVLEANAVEEGHPYHPYLESHRGHQWGELKAADGQTLHWRMLKPLGFEEGKRYPVVVRVYGGPHVQVVQKRWDERWGLVDQLLAQRGFIVYSLDNRGSARRGVAFESPIHRRMGGPEVEDQMVGIRWLREQPFVDPGRIGVFGWSYGGYMSLMLLAKHSDAIAGGVAVAPVTEWRLYDTHYTERYMDHPGPFAKAYDEAAVFAHLDGLKSPLYLIHGMADDNVLFTHSTRLMADLQQRGVMFDLMAYPGGKHGIAGQAPRTHVFKAITGWLEQELKR